MSSTKPAMTSRFPLRLIPALLCLPLLFVVEFQAIDAQTGQQPSRFYTLRFGPGLRLADLCVLGLAALQFLIVRQRVAVLSLPRELAVPTFLAVSAWALALVYGAMTGGTQLFHDWRSVALGGVVAFIVASAVRTRNDLSSLWTAFLAFCAAFSVYSVVRHAVTGGVEITGIGTTPVYDEKILAVLTFAGILAVSLWLSKARLGRISPFVYGLPCILVVLLAMRRIPWIELVIGLGLAFVLQGGTRRRAQGIMALALIGVAIVLVLGPSRLGARLRSLNPSARGTPEAVTNQDHVNDLWDAWDVVKTSPVLGIGLGKPYRTKRIAAWKSESTLVHNGPLHVWVYYGLLGLAAYISWHVAFFAFILRVRRRWRDVASDEGRLIIGLLGAVLAWGVAVFVGRLTFFTSIHLSLQQMILVGAIWGVVFQRGISSGVVQSRSASRPLRVLARGGDSRSWAAETAR